MNLTYDDYQFFLEILTKLENKARDENSDEGDIKASVFADLYIELLTLQANL